MSQEAKKKTIIISLVTTILVALVTILCFVFISANKQLNNNSVYGGYYYSGGVGYAINGDTTTRKEVIACEYDGTTKNVTIPNSINMSGTTYSVVRMLDGLFSGQSALESVYISNSTIYNLPRSTFSGCTNLKSVTLGPYMTSIGYNAFSGCRSLTSVSSLSSSMNLNILTIYDSAFSGCASLTEIYLGRIQTSDVTTQVSVNGNAFSGCVNLMRVVVRATTFYAMDNAFKGCHKLLEVINNSTSVVIAGAISIQGSSYEDYLGYYAKRVSTTDNTKYQTKDNVKYYIDSSKGHYIAVDLIGTPTSITLNSSCNEINASAFSGDTCLESISYSDNVVKIGEDAFGGCTSLMGVYYSGTMANWCNIDFDNVNANPLCYAHNLYIDNQLVTNFIIPNTITELKNFLFYGASCLENVVIPVNILSIGTSAFSGCSGLEIITIPDSVTSIGDSVFFNCIGLTSVTIENGITSISNSAFAYCSGLETLTIPNSVTSIGNYAFQNCTSLVNITISANITDIGTSVFSGCGNLMNVYYMGTIQDWCDIDLNTRLDNVQNLYIDNQLITNLVIPHTVTRIKKFAFASIGSLQSLVIHNGVTSIGTSAFNGCSNLTEVFFLRDYSSGLKYGYSNEEDNSINDYAFTVGNSAAKYYFLNQTSRDRIANFSYGSYYSAKKWSNFFTVSNFIVMTPEFHVEINNSDYGSILGNTNPELNESTTLTAVANSGYELRYWLKNGNQFNNNKSITVTFSEYVEYIAVFDFYYTITTNLSKIDRGVVSDGGNYFKDTEITLTATPSDDNVFIKWLKNGNDFIGNTENPLTVIVSSNDTYTAVITKLYTITTNNLSPNEGSINDVSGIQQEDSTLTVTATPNEGAKFFYWLRNGDFFEGSYNNPLVIVVSEDVIYTVVFAPVSFETISRPSEPQSDYSIILTTEYQGELTINPEVCGMVKTYGYGNMGGAQSVRVKAVPTSGYRFVGWKINGMDIISEKYTSNVADILLTDIPNSKMVVAVFDKAT